ncbi:WecB/TagA/CpsF family glycosyltransferase [Aureibacter tunicatorum]|uniref:N-acetylglucosaminyldiphosphoundecaprenol N-acetyl-beta-D-mannosaminyltransferase n=1 Tax=Aureibacter tunicatorum TaxID=866807 RepID=A0AAE4BRF4_9BACT|nr:WecB/TagA/CpsF family glycosyltransferase [Aureibacter tunicatorum]MDR6240159.1 N-acetylglucosaminyldiphosphoundecaprenol N-acetyl-beta-D-mannosaminyltransferase [Aureibacter tunicatorum]BDD05960.1 UDP-N-acetyl-D-mannosamine transferase [Aureibacter tunicatorum]
MGETIDKIDHAIESNTPIQHVVVNAGKMVAMQSDMQLYKSVVESDLINADGQAVVWASRFLGQPLPERVAGIDLMESLVALAYNKGYKCFFFGAKEEVVSKVVDIYSEKYSSDIIAGYRNGYYASEEEDQIARQIGESEAHLLFIAITSPKKEIFMNKYKDIINIPFVMGVGGSFDVVSGKAKRAPIWMQQIGMEWFYRLIQEPKRMWKRYLVGNSKFISLVIREKLGF